MFFSQRFGIRNRLLHIHKRDQVSYDRTGKYRIAGSLRLCIGCFFVRFRIGFRLPVWEIVDIITICHENIMDGADMGISDIFRQFCFTDQTDVDFLIF